MTLGGPRSRRRSHSARSNKAKDENRRYLILGEHRLGCGDGRDTAFLQRVVGDGSRLMLLSSIRPTTCQLEGTQ